jgi:hypothetical protein
MNTFEQAARAAVQRVVRRLDEDIEAWRDYADQAEQRATEAGIQADELAEQWKATPESELFAAAEALTDASARFGREHDAALDVVTDLETRRNSSIEPIAALIHELSRLVVAIENLARTSEVLRLNGKATDLHARTLRAHWDALDGKMAAVQSALGKLGEKVDIEPAAYVAELKRKLAAEFRTAA